MTTGASSGTREAGRRSRLVPLSPDIVRRIEDFLAAGRFAAAGAVVTDLDGTAVHQDGDRVLIPDSVAHGLERVRRAGRPVIVDTLRFPRSIIATFGSEWAELSHAPLPVVCLNGSLIGSIVAGGDGSLGFEEKAAFPLSAAEIDETVRGIEHAIAAGDDELVLFVYGRDWRQGEVIWTPRTERVEDLQRRFVSASRVEASSIDRLAAALSETDILMLTLLDDRPGDRRLAFQHASPSRFLTRVGVDKRSGAEWLARRLGVALEASIGAGDTEMDGFLDAVGLGLHVGSRSLPFRGARDTLCLADPFALGEALDVVVRSSPAVVP